MKKPSLLITGLAFASSLFVAAVALSTVTPHQTPDAVPHSAPTAAAAGADPLVTTVVTRLVRSSAG